MLFAFTANTENSEMLVFLGRYTHIIHNIFISSIQALSLREQFCFRTDNTKLQNNKMPTSGVAEEAALLG